MTELREIDGSSNTKGKSFAERLEEMIKNVLEGKWSVKEFDKNYYFFFIDGTGEDLSERDIEFFSLVNEMLDWTCENPTEDDLRHGILNYKSFLEILLLEYENWKESKGEWKK